jgi:hypothetical protein
VTLVRGVAGQKRQDATVEGYGTFSRVNSGGDCPDEFSVVRGVDIVVEEEDLREHHRLFGYEGGIRMRPAVIRTPTLIVAPACIETTTMIAVLRAARLVVSRRGPYRL